MHRPALIGSGFLPACLLSILSAAGCGGETSGGPDCEVVDCSGHGRCAVRGETTVCLCDRGYTSTGYECIPDPCSDHPCVWGTCRAEGSQAVCECEPGYQGTLCDACADGYRPEMLACVPDTPCDSITCIRGTCRMEGDQPVCDCDLGYAGEQCDQCAPGYHPDGLTCKRNSACDPDPCVHGACSDINGEAVCVCREGYAGERCSQCAAGYQPDGLVCNPIVIDPCDPNPCQTVNRTVCVAVESDYRCDCDPGTHEELGQCVIDTPCSPNPCQEPYQTLCEIIGSEHACHCDPGYHLEGLDCVVDTVCDPATTCSGHGSCTGAGLECACEPGFTGSHCEQCDNGYHPQGDQCVPNTPCDPNPCTTVNRTVCEPQGSGFLCLCDPGYQDQNGDGSCLPDCDLAALSCPEHAHCEDISGQALCRCDSGYQDNDQNGSCQETCATSGLQCPEGEVCDDRSGQAQCVTATRPPIYIAFHWHMHQPIYWPYESIVDTEAAGSMGYSLYTIHLDRSGPYTSWPRDAVNAGRSLPHAGAQVSLSGSLMENLSNLESAGVGFSGWTAPWSEARGWQTNGGNPRLDLVNFGYHHPLMGLIDDTDIRLQVQAHRVAVARTFGGATSKGMFPPECAFSERMIPALAAEGIEWVLVDNVHFDRAHVDYPFRPESNLPPPNSADQVNTDLTEWLQLDGLWAPSPVSAPWGYQPHWVAYTDPVSGEQTRIVAVPAARYEGNEDARGGFGALQYEAVMSQYEHLNTDPLHPMLIVLHHDGDNYGGGTESYYHSNFQEFVNWVGSRPDRFVATTIQDYLDQFPPDDGDVIHVEDGSWSGADNGDPEFQKWNGDPDADGYSPDRNSWAVITAVKNRVLTAEQIQPHSSVEAIVDGTGNPTDKAWHHLLNAETSCYWYWDFSMNGIWDSHPTRAANPAAAHADMVLAGGGDPVGPTIYLPQREPYNPGSGDQPCDFVVWTYVYDLSGLQYVRLHYRVDADGIRDDANELYSGGTWQQIEMSGEDLPSRTEPMPVYKAEEFAAGISGLTDQLVDYYVSSEDLLGNTSRSALMHVFVGSGGSQPEDLWTPANPTSDDLVTIRWNQPARLHWGVDASVHGGLWGAPPEEYWPGGSFLWSDGLAIESPLDGPDPQGHYTIELGPFNQTPVTEINFVFHNDDGSWSSPDHTIPIAE